MELHAGAQLESPGFAIGGGLYGFGQFGLGIQVFALPREAFENVPHDMRQGMADSRLPVEGGERNMQANI